MAKAQREIYRKLYQLVPNLDGLPVGKDPWLLEKAGEIPVNLHITARDEGRSILSLCRYPRHPSGQLVPDPDVQFHLDHRTKTARPDSYFDCDGSKEGDEAIMAKAAYDWLASLQREGYAMTGQDSAPSR